MNYIFLLFLIAHFSMFCAEQTGIELTSIQKNQRPQQPWSPKKENLEEIMSKIDTAINQKYPRNFASSLVKKQEYEYLDIINTIDICYPSINIDDNLIEQLKAKNKNFSDALDYFSIFAKKNVDTVACDTLQYVEDSTQKQPILQLNQLPQAIKAYLMKTVYNKIDHSYIITLKTGSDIHLCDVCPKKHLAATYHANKNIYIWDLKKNTHEDFVKSCFVKVIVFNPYEPQLVIGRQEKDRIEPVIEIWNLENKQLIHKLIFKDYEYDLLDINFSNKTDGKYIISAGLERLMHQWILEEEKCSDVGGISGIKAYPRNNDNVKKGCYTIDCTDSIFGKSQVTITKKRRKLFLCEQAVKSLTKQEDIAKITLSQSYKPLTELERAVITKAINEKLPSHKK